MLNEKQLSEYFTLNLPIADGEFWDGKPRGYSNLKQWGLNFSQRFGQSLLDYSQFGLLGHNGVDFSFMEGCPIVAPCRMYITYAEMDAGYGNHIWAETETKEINGDGYKLELVFGHLKEIVCKAYHWYNEGELIGYGDSTGFSTGHHLHFGIRPIIRENGWRQMFLNNGYKGWIDPEPFLPHIVWDWSELNELKNMLKKFKRGKDGSLYFVKDGKKQKILTVLDLTGAIVDEFGAETLSDDKLNSLTDFKFFG